MTKKSGPPGPDIGKLRLPRCFRGRDTRGNQRKGGGENWGDTGVQNPSGSNLRWIFRVQGGGKGGLRG